MAATAAAGGRAVEVCSGHPAGCAAADDQSSQRCLAISRLARPRAGEREAPFKLSCDGICIPHDGRRYVLGVSYIRASSKEGHILFCVSVQRTDYMFSVTYRARGAVASALERAKRDISRRLDTRLDVFL